MFQPDRTILLPLFAAIKAKGRTLVNLGISERKRQAWSQTEIDCLMDAGVILGLTSAELYKQHGPNGTTHPILAARSSTRNRNGKYLPREMDAKLYIMIYKACSGQRLMLNRFKAVASFIDGFGLHKNMYKS